MDNILFLQKEIKYTLDMLPFENNTRMELMASIANEPEENLLELLKVLYRIEREYLQMLYDDTIETDKFLQTLKPAHD